MIWWVVADRQKEIVYFNGKHAAASVDNGVCTVNVASNSYRQSTHWPSSLGFHGLHIVADVARN